MRCMRRHGTATCAAGLLDGPLGFAAALLAAGGPAAEPGQAVIRTNVGNLALNLLQEAGSVSCPAVPCCSFPRPQLVLRCQVHLCPRAACLTIDAKISSFFWERFHYQFSWCPVHYENLPDWTLLQVPPGMALAELSPAGALALVSCAAQLASPEGLNPSVLLRRDMLPGALALLAPAHLRALVNFMNIATESYTVNAGELVYLQVPLLILCGAASWAQSDHVLRCGKPAIAPWHLQHASIGPEMIAAQAAWPGPGGREDGVLQLICAVTDLLAAPLRPTVDLSPAQLQQYLVRRLEGQTQLLIGHLPACKHLQCAQPEDMNQIVRR